MSVYAGGAVVRSSWWLGALKILAITVMVIGLLAQPVTMLLVNVFWPHTIYDSLSGRVDPLSNSWFWVTVLGPSLGTLMFTAYHLWKASLGDPDVVWQELLARWFIGLAVAFVLLPVMFMVTLLLPSLLR